MILLSFFPALQSPLDFMPNGMLEQDRQEDEPVGLRLIPGYHVEVLRIETLSRIEMKY